MIAVALGWMIGTGIVLAFTAVSPFTGIGLIVFGILGLVELFVR